jgi:hypothetical protein
VVKRAIIAQTCAGAKVRLYHWLPKVLAAAAGLLLAPSIRAQDPFEIHIYEYEPLTRGEYSLEAQLNYDPFRPLRMAVG